MRIIAQDKKSDVIYEEGSLKIKGPRIYYVKALEEIYLGMYTNAGHNKTVQVLEMIRNAAQNGVDCFYMPANTDIK